MYTFENEKKKKNRSNEPGTEVLKLKKSNPGEKLEKHRESSNICRLLRVTNNKSSSISFLSPPKILWKVSKMFNRLNERNCFSISFKICC